MNGSSPKAVLLPIDMGNYGRNSLQPKEIFERLCTHSQEVQFLAYHWRRSGNFVFSVSKEETGKRALETGEAVIGLKCLFRTFSDLRKVNRAVPPDAEIKNGSVILPTGEKLIHVALSKTVIKTARAIGKISPRVKILAWPSPRDVLCAYARPPRGGDVGQATNNVLKVFRDPAIHGTGRALSVIQDVLEDRNMRYA